MYSLQGDPESAHNKSPEPQSNKVFHKDYSKNIPTGIQQKTTEEKVHKK